MQTKRTGFTLIELLVVIAIIAILAAILFPVFTRARAKARQAACTSNLKQIAICFQMYVQANGRYPKGAGEILGYPSMGGKYLCTPYNSFIPTTALAPYAKNEDIFWCSNSDQWHHDIAKQTKSTSSPPLPLGMSDYSYGNVEEYPSTGQWIWVQETPGPRTDPAKVSLATCYWGNLAHVREKPIAGDGPNKYPGKLIYMQAYYDGHVGIRAELSYW
jgi:prepilin-type N-terminal cleavage/methylation domain-containing protein